MLPSHSDCLLLSAHLFVLKFSCTPSFYMFLRFCFYFFPLLFGSCFAVFITGRRQSGAIGAGNDESYQFGFSSVLLASYHEIGYFVTRQHGTMTPMCVWVFVFLCRFFGICGLTFFPFWSQKMKINSRKKISEISLCLNHLSFLLRKHYKKVMFKIKI